MSVEIAAFKFKFDADALPTVRSDPAKGFTVGKAFLDDFNHIAEFFRKHAEEKDNSLFIQRLVPHAVEACGITVSDSAFKGRAECFNVEGTSSISFGILCVAASRTSGKKS